MEEINVKKFELSDRVFMLSGLLVLVVAVSIIGGLVIQYKALPQNVLQDIIVSGTGKVFAKPDVAMVSLGVKTQALKSQDAVSQNNEKMNAVIKAVKDLGVAEKDIQTTNYNLSPVYDWTEKGQVFKGYTLDQAVAVKIRNFDKINDILDASTSAGANTVGSLQFVVDNKEKALSEARVLAIAEAKAKAEDMAKVSGLSLVKIVNVSEAKNNYPQPFYGMGITNASEKSATPDIQTGQSEIDLTVSLTYRVK